MRFNICEGMKENCPLSQTVFESCLLFWKNVGMRFNAGPYKHSRSEGFQGRLNVMENSHLYGRREIEAGHANIALIPPIGIGLRSFKQHVSFCRE